MDSAQFCHSGRDPNLLKCRGCSTSVAGKYAGSVFERHPPPEHRSATFTLELEGAMELLGPATHVVQPQSALPGRVWTEPAPVVGDLQQAFVAPHAEADGGLGGLSMATYVGHRLSDGGQNMLRDRVGDGRVHRTLEDSVHFEAHDNGELA